VAEIYFRVGHLLLVGAHDSIFDDEIPALRRFEQGYFYIHTAAALNHKRARFVMAVLIENGLIPSKEVTKLATNGKFSFLPVLDPTALIFIERSPSLLEFEKISQASALE
jgi:hypothetical protein